MEFGLQPLGFMEFLQNNNHPAVNSLMIIAWLKLHETQGSQTKFHGIKYIYLIFIYSLLL